VSEARQDEPAPPQLRPLVWVGPALEELKAFPRPVQGKMGRALLAAQRGGKHPSAKPLRGFGGAGVLEIIEDHEGNTYRAVYTVKLPGTIYCSARPRGSRAGASRLHVRRSR
jgi:phage-related protein